MGILFLLLYLGGFMMDNGDIAIQAINKTELEDEIKLITACEFITHMNLDNQFKEFLKEKFTEKEKDNSI